MRKKWGVLCMALGAVLILSALSLFLYNRVQDSRAGKSAGQVLPYVQQAMKEDTSGGDSLQSENSGSGSAGMKTCTIQGYDYIGTLSIPALGRELPIMSTWDYTRLKTAPCRQYGTPETNDFVIAAHNYSWHFGRLSALSPGCAVTFTDMDNNVYHYTVKDVTTIQPTAVSWVQNSGYDLILYTCTYGGAKRVVVCCDRTEA